MVEASLLARSNVRYANLLTAPNIFAGEISNSLWQNYYRR